MAFSMKLKRNGHLARESELRALVERHLDPHLRRAGLAVQAGVQGVTPVRTGTLRRSMNTGQPEWAGKRRRVKVGTALIYAPIVNRRGRSKGYFKRGIDASKGQARNILQSGVRDLARELWIR
jgi:hypothetical protein